jgi:hypothetical protein
VSRDFLPERSARPEDAHAKEARELESYLRVDASNKIKSLEYAPSLDEVPELLLTVGHCILLGGDAIAKTFGVPFDAKSRHVKFIENAFASLGPTGAGPRPA